MISSIASVPQQVELLCIHHATLYPSHKAKGVPAKRASARVTRLEPLQQTA